MTKENYNINNFPEEIYNKIISFLESGKTVYFANSYKITKVSKKHIKLLSWKKGQIFIGKICYNGTRITVGE
jgi:hypothetical protein